MEVTYNFDDPFFKKAIYYEGLAREHICISQLKSDKIKWRVKKKETHLNIPTKYEVDYFVKSIIGINADQSPIYGEKHTVEISFPAKFPLETYIAKTTTKVWHPNIRWEGGRICVNNRRFGSGYDLFWLLVRIGEIIQYKNYLAENVKPFPEDPTVAKWVLNYAEPNKIVDIKNKIAVDNSNLMEYTPPKPLAEKIIIKKIVKSENKPKKITIKMKKNNPK